MNPSSTSAQQTAKAQRYMLDLTFNWQSQPIPGTSLYPLGHQLCFSDGTPVPKEKTDRHDFQHRDLASLRVFRDGENGIPTKVTFAFTHLEDCPPQSVPDKPGQNDNPFENYDGPSAAWSLVETSKEVPVLVLGSTINEKLVYWKVAGTDPKVTLKSKKGKAGENWHFAIYLDVSGPGDEGTSRVYRFDPELVVDPW